MAEHFFALSIADRRDVLDVAATKSGRPAHLLEKDMHVVWALDVLFKSRLGEHLVFKGGTSLSKAYRAIDRFSEDVDLTYDIRAYDLVDDMVADMIQGEDAQLRAMATFIASAGLAPALRNREWEIFAAGYAQRR